MPTDLIANTTAAATLIRALNSPLRLQILHCLSQRDCCVYELVRELGRSQPLVSQHLRILKQSGLVSSHSCGREVTYQLTRREALNIAAIAASIAP